MSLRLRVFLAYTVVAVLAAWFVFSQVMTEITPAVRQSTEENLVDTAHLVAAMVREPMAQGRMEASTLESVFRDFNGRQPGARIWDTEKNATALRILITDGKGTVVADSAGLAIGQDYSRWNDIYLTLRGLYGARSTPDPENPAWSIMHVAAPVLDADHIIGVVSVAKSSRSLQPWVERAQDKLLLLGSSLLIGGLLTGILLAWWLTQQLRELQHYAAKLANGERATPPTERGASHEFRALGRALDSMRQKLDGKAYVERYTQTLAHELRSPLAGVAATAELLHRPMTDEQRERFVTNIEREAARMHSLTERMLTLATLEQQQTLQACTYVPATDLLDDLVAIRQEKLTARESRLVRQVSSGACVYGDPVLLRLSISNLLDNAIDFCQRGGTVSIHVEASEVGSTVRIHNEGASIPDYALSRVSERFFSLPRPDTGAKSSGLGLNLVSEIMALHRGQFSICNTDTGVEAKLFFPVTAAHTNTTQSPQSLQTGPSSQRA